MAVARSGSSASLARSGSAGGRMGDDVMNFRLQREQARIGSVTASLIWNDPSDLDLHAFASLKAGGNAHISYRNKQAQGGNLDVDMNAGVPSLEPVENIFWEEPPAGKYILKVQNFRTKCQAPDFTDGNRKVPFRVSLKLKGGPYSFEGTVGCKQTVECFQFSIDEEGDVTMKPVKKGAAGGLRSLKTMEVLRTVEKKVDKVLKTKKLRAVGPGAMKKATAKAMKAMKKAIKKKPIKKVMKPMKKAMKPMKPKAQTTATGRLSMYLVKSGKRKQTKGGLKATDIIKNKAGNYVSKKKSEHSKTFPWIVAVKAARTALGITGFQVLGGSTPAGKAYLAKAREIFGESKTAPPAQAGSGLARASSGALARAASE